MSTTEFLANLRHLDVHIWAEGDALRLNAPKGVLTNQLRQQLAERKEEILAFLRRAVVSAPSAITPVPREGEIPLSLAQQRLWFLDRLQPGSHLYNEPAVVRLRGHLDAGVLERCLSEVARRHEILRTSFRESGGRPFQVIAPELRVSLPMIDLSGDGEAEREADALRRIHEEARRSFDLARGPLMRALLLRLGEREHLLSLVLHHIVSDGWSTGILVSEVATLYEAFSAGRPSPLPELPVQYADFAAWQRQSLQGEALELRLAYWRERLQDAQRVLDLPADYARPPVPSNRGARQAMAVPAVLTQKLRELARREGATLFSALMAAYQALLSIYSGQEDLVVGTASANRERVETEELIGFFVNVLPVRIRLGGDPVFRELLRSVQEAMVDAGGHGDLPFDRLVEDLQVPRDASRTPVFQAFFVLQNFPIQLRLPGLELERIDVDTGTAKFDLTLDLTETPDGLRGILEYSADLFSPGSVAHLAGHFLALLRRVAEQPESRLSELRLLAEPGARPALEVEPAAPPLSPVDLFEAQVERTPDAPALIAGGEELSYRQLNGRANQLAHHLREIGVGPEALAGLCVGRSADMIVGLLGILKAGGACVPLDPEYPEERLRFMLEDSAPPVVVALRSLLSDLPIYAAGREVVCLDSDAPGLAGQPEVNPSRQCPPESLAYVIYTSGSTGTPKGVGVSHAVAGRHMPAAVRAFGLGPGDRVLQFASLNFDVSLEQIFGALVSGATLVLRPAESWGPREITRQVREAGLTVVNLPTALWHQWAAERAGRPREEVGEQLRLVISGGDAISPEAVRSWQSSPLGGVRLLNAYGPTEAIITSTLFEAGAAEPAGATLPERIPIGIPLGGRSAEVTGPTGEDLPALIPGELAIGSDLLARGYLNRPGLTAERFVPDPGAGQAGGRRYRTGDLARRRTDGSLEFLGRIDQQVKVRGFRIELGDVESAIAAHPAVSEAVVVARPDASGDKALAAYVVPRNGALSSHELRAFVEGKLPRYMVPLSFQVLARLPLTPGGKVDRHALPAPQDAAGETAGVLPRNSLEETLAGIWGQVLGRERIGVHDDFFELGGHSLLGTQLISRINDAFGIDLPLAALFAASTVAGLASRVAEERPAAGEEPSIVRGPRTGPQPLSFAQQRLWFLDQMEPGSSAYSVPSAIRLTGALNVDALERAFQELIRRHESLHTTFQAVDGMPVQVIAEAPPRFELGRIDLTLLSPEKREEEVARLAAPDSQAPFDLSRGPLIRADLLALAPEEHVILVTIHHIVCDDWSVGVILRELAAIYSALSSGRPSPLPEPELQYADFARWQRERLQGEALEELLSFWRRQLEGVPPVLELPADFPRPRVQTSRGAVLSRTLPRDLTDGLKALSQREGVTLYMTLLAGFLALLYAATGRLDLVVGTSIANRNRVEIEGMVGFFVNMLVLRTQLAGDPTMLEMVGRARDVALAAYAHQDLPFDRLVEELRVGRYPGRNPVFQVAFTFENTPNKVVALPGLTLRALDVGVDTSVFDIALVMEERDGELTATFRYMTSLFRAATVEGLLDELGHVLRRLVEQPGTSLGEVAAELAEVGRRRKLAAQKSLEDASLAKLQQVRRRPVGV